VFVAAGSSVAALDYRCRTDGGVCAKRLWRTAIGAQVSAGLTLRDGVVFVPGADGRVHVLSASNGALHASITPHYGTGPVTQPVSFAPDGTIYIVQDNHFYATGPDGSFDYGSGGALQTMSQMAVGNARAFATDEVSEIVLAYLYVPGLSNPIDPACVQTPRPPVQPVAAPDVVFFAFCSLFGAYDPETLLPRWTAPGYASGMALAGGVLYVCKGERVVAFDARDGRLLGSSAPCEGSPEVANGTVFSTRFSLYATTLDGVDNTVSGARPDPSGLRPAPRVHGRSH
jgi:hypothetical protein